MKNIFGNVLICRRRGNAPLTQALLTSCFILKSGSYHIFYRRSFRSFVGTGILLLVLAGNILHANPTGGAVTQGAATFSTSGSQFTVNQTSPDAFINWQTFNIAAGETTTFNQPSDTSVTWNHVNDSNPSRILGTLNANGYVILQNHNGFYVGGQASINTHGLVMTTASTPTLNLSSGGPWSFNTPPPAAKIINYGRINIAGGGSAFLIADDIENNGTISAPGGKIGLYAGQKVLVSTAPDGRGLSAQAIIPQGLVDNNGNLIADGGSIALHAQMVNQNGLIQANSAKEVNGTIELVGSGAVNLGANSVISAHGDTEGTSPGGSVTIKSDNSFSDQTGSTINVAGGAQGGNGGPVEISAPQMGAINSIINGQAWNGFNGGTLTIDPNDITLDSTYINTLNNEISGGLSQINLQADNITLSTTWNLADETASSTLSLSAGNNITLNGSLYAGNDWNVNLTAGTAFPGTGKPASGSDGIYVNGNLQTQNGNLTLNAANEVMVGGGGVRTVGGGNIDVTTEFGNVNTGSSANGFNWLASSSAPFYTPSTSLGGISTAAGGNVNIKAGGDVISFPTITPTTSDPGTGAFGPEPGNVTINAGGSVYGCYVVMNGAGTINAQNVGTSTRNVALSLAKGSWNLDAQGNIYLQEARNPNGVFNNSTAYIYNPVTGKVTHGPTPGAFLFDYDPHASVTLTAGNGVYLTGYNLPRVTDYGVPMLLPPTLIVNAGPGGFTLYTPNAVDANQQNVLLSDYDITLFPSPYGNLQIITTGGGGLVGIGNSPTLLMSDSARTKWNNSYNGQVSGTQPFGEDDHASVPPELNNPDPVVFNISGNMENVTLQLSKFAQINIGGNMTGCTFYGENLQPSQTTSIIVGGQIYNAISFTTATLDQNFPSLPSNLLPLNAANSLFQILYLAVNPTLIANLSTASVPPSQLASYYKQNAGLYQNLSLSGVSYSPNTKKLTVAGSMSGGLLAALTAPTLTFVVYKNGAPELDSSGHFVTQTIPWMPANSADYFTISKLYQESQTVPPLNGSDGGYVVGGTGTFDVTANSISLGNSLGILSVGSAGNYFGGRDYSFLAPYITSGATINVKVLGQQQTVNNQTEPSLFIPASTIAALASGDVNVSAPNGSMDLGSSDLVDLEGQIMHQNGFGWGIYTTGGGNVNVTALGDINVDTSRIASFNGGDVFVESYTGNINAGSGGSTFNVPVLVFPVDAPVFGEQVYANGIVAETLINPSQVPGGATVPGNITVLTPEGSIIANQGGIKQEALNGTAPTGPTITLTAGTPAVPGDFNSSEPPLYVGNIELGTVGVIGESVIAQATGKITGLAVSQHNTSITSQSVGSLTVLAGGQANVSAQSSGSGAGITIIGGQGVNASGIGAGATLLGQNVSVNGGAATATLGTTATATAASQSAAGQSSSEAQQQVASNSGEEKKKKKKKKAELVRSIGRVTVILPQNS